MKFGKNINNRSMKTKILILNRGGHLEIKELLIEKMKKSYHIPKDFICVKSKYTGICGSDLHKIRLGNFRRNIILGHECVVIYEDKTYVVNPIISCKKCKWCSKGYENLCENIKTIGFNFPGGFSQYFYLPKKNLYEIDENDIVYVLLDAFASVYHGLCLIEKNLRENKSEEVAIIGDGTIGILSAFLLNKIFRYHQINVIGKHVSRIKIFEDILSGKIEFNLFSEKLKKRLKNTSSFVIEAVGSGSEKSISLAISIVKPKGIILVFGVFDPFKVYKIPLRELFSKEVMLVGSRSYTSKEFKDSLVLFNRYKRELSKLVNYFQVSDIETIYQILNSYCLTKWKDKFLKLVIDFSEKNV